MDNIDTGVYKNYRFGITSTSLVDDKLNISFLHKNKISDTNKMDIGEIIKDGKKQTWDVNSIELFRNNKEVDSTGNLKDNQDGQEYEISENLITSIDETLYMLLSKVKTGNGIKFITTEGDIDFCCYDVSNGVYVTQIISDETNKLKGDTFVFKINGDLSDDEAEDSLYELNKKNWYSSNNKFLTVSVEVRSSQRSKVINLTNIKDIEYIKTCEDVDEPEEESEKDYTNDDEKRKEAVEVTVEMLAKDKTLQAAFYTQPNFWQLLRVELEGGKAVGTGIVPTLNLVGRYADKSISDRLGDNFSVGGKVSFEPQESVSIRYYNKKGEPTDFILKSGEIYEGDYAVTVKRFSFDDDLTQKNKVLQNGSMGFKIIVKESTDQENIFLCDIIKIYYIENTSKSSTEENIYIRLLDSQGYNTKERK